MEKELFESVESIEEIEETEETVVEDDTQEELLLEEAEEVEEEEGSEETVEIVQVQESAVGLVPADLAQHLERTNTLLACIIFAMFCMYFRTIILSIRRGV